MLLDAYAPCYSGGVARRLTEKQRRFVEAYMGEAAGNGTRAAELAGYQGNRRTLESIGSENLRKPEIVRAMTQRVADDPVVADRKLRQQFWSDVMRDVDVELRWRLKASELLGKSQGDFVERRIINDGGTIASEDIAKRRSLQQSLVRDPEIRNAMNIVAKKAAELGVN
jgi:phage terminase small subunit